MGTFAVGSVGIGSAGSVGTAVVVFVGFVGFVVGGRPFVVEVGPTGSSGS